MSKQGISKEEKILLYKCLQLGIIEFNQEVQWEYRGKKRKVMCLMKNKKGSTNENSN